MSFFVQTAARASSLIYGIANGYQETHDLKNSLWLIPANVCFAVPYSLMIAGARFEFIDINPKSLSMDIQAACTRVNDKDAARVHGVIYVRSYGQNSFGDKDVSALRASSPNDILIVDDQCLCIPQTEIDKVEDSDADAILFSTGYGKIVDLGGGSYGFLRQGIHLAPPPSSYDPDAFLRIQRSYQKAITAKSKIDLTTQFSHDPSLRNWLPNHDGLNWEFLKQDILTVLPKVIAHKKHLNDIYDTEIKQFGALPRNFQTWRYNLNIAERDILLKDIFTADLYASAHFFPANQVLSDTKKPATEKLSQTILNLFNDFHFSETQAYALTKIIARHHALYGSNI